MAAAEAVAAVAAVLVAVVATAEADSVGTEVPGFDEIDLAAPVESAETAERIETYVGGIDRALDAAAAGTCGNGPANVAGKEIAADKDFELELVVVTLTSSVVRVVARADAVPVVVDVVAAVPSVVVPGVLVVAAAHVAFVVLNSAVLPSASGVPAWLAVRLAFVALCAAVLDAAAPTVAVPVVAARNAVVRDAGVQDVVVPVAPAPCDVAPTVAAPDAAVPFAVAPCVAVPSAVAAEAVSAAPTSSFPAADGSAVVAFAAAFGAAPVPETEAEIEVGAADSEQTWMDSPWMDWQKGNYPADASLHEGVYAMTAVARACSYRADEAW